MQGPRSGFPKRFVVCYRILFPNSFSLGGFFSQDLPGAFDNAMPLLFPPYFGGEVHVRPYFFGLVNGEIVFPVRDKD